MLFIASFFKKTPFNNSYYLVLGTVFFMYLLDEIRKDRFSEITIDTENKKIVFLYKSVFSEKKQKMLPFENAKVEIRKTSANKFLLRKVSITLYFLKNKLEICELNTTKDGFSTESLSLICKTLENITQITKSS